MARKDKKEKKKGKGKKHDGMEAAGLYTSAVELKDSTSPYFATGWFYVLGLVALVVTAVVQQLVKVSQDGSTPKRKHKRRMSMLGWYNWIVTKVLIDWNPFWDRIVEEEVPLDSLERACIVMTNHTSFSDAVFFTGSFNIPTTAVAKDDLFTTPIYGSIARNNGLLPVYFKKKPNGKWTTDKAQMDKMMEKAEEKLGEGVFICLAPEGTIPADVRKVGEFKPGFFRLAIKTNTEIVPCGTWGNQKAWPMGEKDKRGYVNSQFYIYPGRSYIKSGKPVPPLDYQDFVTNETVIGMIENVVNSDQNDLTQDDFTEENIDTIGRKLSNLRETDEAAKELFDELVALLTDKIHGYVVDIVEELKIKLQEYEDEQDRQRAETANFLSKKVSIFA